MAGALSADEQATKAFSLSSLSRNMLSCIASRYRTALLICESVARSRGALFGLNSVDISSLPVELNEVL